MSREELPLPDYDLLRWERQHMVRALDRDDPQRLLEREERARGRW